MTKRRVVVTGLGMLSPIGTGVSRAWENSLKGVSGANRIASVLALDVHTGQRLAFPAPRFIDCTGHGWIGYFAGAEAWTLDVPGV